MVFIYTIKGLNYSLQTLPPHRSALHIPQVCIPLFSWKHCRTHSLRRIHIVPEYPSSDTFRFSTTPWRTQPCSCLSTLSSYIRNTCSPHWTYRSGSFRQEHSAYPVRVRYPRTPSLSPSDREVTCRSRSLSFSPLFPYARNPPPIASWQPLREAVSVSPKWCFCFCVLKIDIPSALIFTP